MWRRQFLIFTQARCRVFLHRDRQKIKKPA